jgi:hypothetical protein
VFRQQIGAPLQQAYEIASAAMAENLGYASARDGIDRFLKGER